MFNLKKSTLAGFVALAFASNAMAQDILVLNHNFDSDAIPPNPGYLQHISGWVSSGFGDIGVKAPNHDQYHSMGNHGQVAFLTAGARLTQTAPVNLQQGETYTLSFDAGTPLNFTPGDAAPQYMVRFKADGLVLGQKQLSASTPGEWQTQSVSFTGDNTMPVGKPLVLEFYNTATVASNLSNGAYELHIDNVTLKGDGKGEPLPPRTVGDNGLTMVGVNLTLKVPEVFPTIPDALNYMKDKFIKVGKTVTIKVSDCTNQRYSQPIYVNHPNGDSIHIIGKSDNPADCVLNFNGSSGFVVNGGTALGLLDGFHLNGSEADSSYGVLAAHLSHITLGKSVWVSNFAEGVRATRNSSVIANGVTSFSNKNHGFEAIESGVIRAENARSYDNGFRGFMATHDSILLADHSESFNNGHQGYFSTFHSYMSAQGASARSNGHQGMYPQGLSMISARFASATSNGSTAFYSYHAGLIDRVQYQGGSTSPGIGAQGNNGSVTR